MASKSRITIPIKDIEEYASVCAALVREGVIFTSTLSGKEWVIEFTGGY